MNKTTIYIFTFLLISNVISAQYNLTGKVIDSKTSLALAGVEVFDLSGDAQTITDEDGSYTLSNLASGLHELAFFSFQYDTKYKSIELSADQVLDVEMNPLGVQLSEVIITQRREKLFALRKLKDVSGTAIYAGKKTEAIMMSKAMGNLANNNSRQIFAQIAGLNIYEGSNGGLQLGIGGRGLDPNRTANFNTRQNGYDISADVLGYPENYYTPPAEALSEIQVIRGAASLQYGTQFGGLINFKMKKIPSFKQSEFGIRQTIGSFGLVNTFISGGLNKDKWSFNTHYNYKKGNGYRNNSNFDAHHLFLHTKYKASDKLSIEGELTSFQYLSQQAGGLTDQLFNEDPRISTRTRNWFEVDWKVWNVKMQYTPTEFSQLDVSIFGLNAERNSVGYRGNPVNLNENPVISLDEQNSNGEFILPRDLILGEFRNWGVETRYLTKYDFRDKRSVLLVGAKVYQANNTSLQGPGSTGIDADFGLYTESFPEYPNQSNFTFPNFNVSAFSENIFYLTDKFSITPGLRFEYIRTESQGTYNTVVFDNAGNPINNRLNTDNRILPRSFFLAGVGISYKSSRSSEFYANVSQNYRSVTFSDIRTVNPTFIVDPNISDEKGFTSDMGVRGLFGKTISYDVSLYSILYDDRIGIIFNERANRVRKNIGQALIYGVESLVDINLIKLAGKDASEFKCNVFFNTALTDSKYLKSEENNVVGKKVEFIPFVNLKSGLNFGYNNFLCQFQFTYVSSQYTDVQNSEAAPAGDIRSGVIGEIPSYHIADFSTSYRIKRFRIEAGVNNLFDTAYFTRRASGYPGPGIIPSDGRGYYLTVGYEL